METKEEGFFDFLLGYRKTLAWVAMFAISIVFRLKGYIDGGQFVDLSKATFLGFITGNLGEHLGNLGQAYFNSKAGAAVEAKAIAEVKNVI
jgi:hypothetical protein